MAHIILVNPKLDQVETHKVDPETFAKVWDILHEGKNLEGKSFGTQQAINRVEKELPKADAMADALANSSYDEPEIEVVDYGKALDHKPEKKELDFGKALLDLMK